MARFDAFSPDFEHPFINSSPDYSSRNGSYSSRAIGEMTTPLSFRERNKRLKSIENEKNQLIEVWPQPVHAPLWLGVNH